MSTIHCAACGAPRELADVIGVTEVGDPRRLFYVCRPIRRDGRMDGECFRRGVGGVWRHRIGPAVSERGGGPLGQPAPRPPRARRSHNAEVPDRSVPGRGEPR